MRMPSRVAEAERATETRATKAPRATKATKARKEKRDRRVAKRKERTRKVTKAEKETELGAKAVGTSEGQSRSGDEPGRYDAARGTIIFIVYFGESSSAAHNQG